MVLAQKRTKRSQNQTRRVRKRASTASDARQMVQRIDAMIRELETMRQQLTVAVPPTAPEPGLTERLFGALGHGTWEEYDPDLDWKRFSEDFW